MARVAIVGSCITRDLWPRAGGGAEDLCYVSRTSLPGLFSKPVEGFRAATRRPGGLTPHQHNALAADLTKTALSRLVAFEPTHLVFDFIDERFDLLEIDGALALESWELTQSGYASRPALRNARRVPRLSRACDLIWRRGVEEMAGFIRATPLRNACLILHESRWATQWRDDRGRLRPIADVEVLAGRKGEIGAHNELLEAYEAWFLELMPPALRIGAGKHRIADPAHQWGLSPFHYIPEYYEEIWRQFQTVGITRQTAGGASAWPSAPAA